MDKETSLAHNQESQLQNEIIRNPKYALAIFDFHGTVTDHQLRTIRSMHTAGHEALGIHLGKKFYQETLTRPSHSHSTKRGVTASEFIEQKFSDQPQELRKLFKKIYEETVDSTYIPIPGMRSVLRRLRASGIEVVFLTNGSNRESIQQVLCGWGLPDISDHLYSSHITGVKKPDVRSVTAITEDYEKQGRKFERDKILMIGDYIDDIRTAHNLGIDSVLITRGNGWQAMQVKDPKPTFIITDPSDIIKIMQGKIPSFTGDTYYAKPFLWRNENWGPKKHPSSVHTSFSLPEKNKLVTQTG